MKSFTLSELAAATGAKVYGNEKLLITGVNTLEEASTTDASFLANSRYIDAAKASKAGVICIADPSLIQRDKNYLLSPDPSKSFQTIITLLLSPENSKTAFADIHPTAIIHPSAIIGDRVIIGPYTVIDQNVIIQNRTILFPHVYVGPYSRIGEDSIIYPQVVIRERCFIGNRVIIQPGAVIGSCGFGYTNSSDGRFTKLEQLGDVIIEDDVEIGANTTIDRARFKSTKIGRGTKIDNLVQIAHNVEIGENNGIAAQTGIAGSSKTGKNVLFGGQVGVVGHVNIGDNVMIASQAGVSKSLPKPGKYRGTPAIPMDEYNRQEVHVRKLSDLIKQLKDPQQNVGDLCKNKIKP